MPDEENVPNQEESEGEQPKKKKKGGLKRLLIAFLLIVILAGGGAGGFYFWRHRAPARTQADAEGNDHKTGNGAKRSSIQADDTDVKEVVELQPFIVNLADKTETRYLRMTVSLGVGDSSDGKPDPIYTTRVRNAILAVITTKSSDQVLSVEGKGELRKEMLSAARSAVNKPEIHAIYITDFIVQM